MPVSLTIIGNLGAEPEVRTTANNLEIVELRIASQDGKDKTSWWTAKFIGNKAGETAKKFAKKGSNVMVVGVADEESWEKDGQKKNKIVCLASSFSFLGGKSDKPADSAAPKAKTPTQKQQEEQGDDQEVPF